MSSEMHLLLEAAALAALVKSMFPTWISPKTPRINTGNAYDSYSVPALPHFYTQDQPWFQAGQDPPASERYNAVDVEMVIHRVRSESVSVMNFDFGIGFAYFGIPRLGQILYWIRDPLPDELYTDNIWVDIVTYWGRNE